MPAETPSAWVELPAEEVLRAGDRRYAYDFGSIPHMARLIEAHPGIGARFGALYYEIMFAPGHLDRQERELVAAVAAAAQDCHY